MTNEKIIINESKIVASQQKAWKEHHLLYLVNKGSVWRAFNESAYVLSNLLHFQMTRRTRKTKENGKVLVDSVTFMATNLEKVIGKICSEGGVIKKKEVRKIIYQWEKKVTMPEVYIVDDGKDIPLYIKIDNETSSDLEKITSNGGFGGRDKATKSEVVRYAIKHFYDNKPIDLNEADSLIQSISTNRDSLQKGLYNLTGLIKELNAVGNNINQIAHNINFLMLKAAEDNIDVADQIKKINGFYNEVTDTLTELMELTDRLKPSVEPAKVAVLSAMEKENEIMNRLLI